MEPSKLYNGCLVDLPNQSSSVVRVFLSSTFTDMVSERNEILDVAVPELRQFCIEKGLEFEICDMRWGVRDDSSISHSTSDVCLKELKTCQQISQGPNFVAILGNKYGYCPYPSRLEVEEFNTLYSIIADTSTSDATLIDKWFRKDSNATPPMYILQPITDILQHYNDIDPKNKELFEKDQNEWRHIDTELSRILKDASKTAFNKGLISADEKHKFHRSITELEVSEGVLMAQEKIGRVMCFTRDIQDINIQDELAGRYIDLTPESELKEESIEMLTKLKTDKLTSCLEESQLKKYEVKWAESGITSDNLHHVKYLQEFRIAFITGIKDMINICEQNYRKSRAKSEIQDEVLHHLTFCRRKCENFHGRGELIQSLQLAFNQTFERNDQSTHQQADSETEKSKDKRKESDEDCSDEEDMSTSAMTEQQQQADARAELMNMMEHLKEKRIGFDMEKYDVLSDPNKNIKLDSLKVTYKPRYTKPLIIYGESGCGKTAFMAKLAEVISVWSPRSAFLVRFLGTSPQSSSIRETLVSICYQIYQIYDLQPPQFDIKEDFPFLIQYFSALLWKIDSDSKPLYIILDSLDQLNNTDHVFSLNWLPTVLPPNVHIVVSTLPEMFGLLVTLRSRLMDDSLFFEINSLPVNEATELLFKVWSRSAKREFTQPQRQLLKNKISTEAAPLYLKLLFNQATKWHSYTDVTNMQLAITAKSAINKLFDDLEILHGKTLITKAFGYITAARSGLSNTEMEHLLSLDDEVLQDVYLYHLPPNKRSITLPSLIWRRVEYDLGEYLVDRRADGRSVKTWYHRQFHSVAQERYLQKDAKVEIHSAMVDYFLGVWSNHPKPLELYKMKTGIFPEAMRQVPDQPIMFSPTLYNLRKLNELPYHLIYSGQLAEFRQLIGCNIEWLYSKCKAVGLSELLDDLEMALEEARRIHGSTSGENILSDLPFLLEMLILGSDNIRKDPINLPIQILGQLGSDCNKSADLEKLVTQCVEFCKTHPRPLLVPQHPCLPSPGGNLKLSINTYIQSPGNFRNSSYINTSMALKDKNHLLVAEKGGKVEDKDKLKCFDLEDGQCVFTCELDNRTVNIALVNNNRYICLEWTDKRDDYNPTCYNTLLHTCSLIPVNLPDNIGALHFSNDGTLLAYSIGGEVFIKKTEALQSNSSTGAVFQLTLDNCVTHLIFSSDDKHIIITFGNVHQVYEIKSHTCLFEWGEKERIGFGSEKQMHSNVVVTDQFYICPDFSYKNKNKVMVWDLKCGKLVYELQMASEHYGCQHLRLDSRKKYVLLATRDSGIVNGDQNKFAIVYSLESGQQVSECSAAQGPYSDINLFGSDHLFVLAATQQHSVIKLLWLGPKDELHSNAVLVRILVGHNDPIIQLTVTPDKILSASADNTIKVWDLGEIMVELMPKLEDCHCLEDVRFTQSLEENKLPIPGRDQIKTTAMVICQNRAIVGSEDGFVIFYDLDTCEQQSYLRLHHRQIVTMVVTRDNQRVAIATSEAIFIMRADQDVVEREIPTRKSMNCLAASNEILVGGHGGMEAYGFVWNIDTGEKVTVVQGLYGFQCIAVNSTGTKLAGSFFEFPLVYDIYSGEPLTSMEGADVMMSGQSYLHFSPDDSYLAGGCSDGSIRIMDGQTGKYLYRFQQLSSSIAACFSPDSKILVTSGFRTLYLWSLEKKSLLRSLTRHQDFVVKIKFSADGRFLVSSSKDKRIIVWDWNHLYSVSAYLSHCPINVMDVADDLSSIVYAPDSVDYVAVLKPNSTLSQKIQGQLRSKVPCEVQDAQAVALSFSSQGLRRETTQACRLL